VYNLFNRYFSWNFLNNFNYSLDYGLMRHNSLLYSFELNEFIYHFLNNSINLYIDVLLNVNLLNSGLNNCNLQNFLNFFDSFFNYDLRHNSLNYLWNLYYLLNNTGYKNNFFNYFFNLYNFWYLYHLLYNLLNWDFDLFNSIHMS
jgi:hypothetical protein